MISPATKSSGARIVANVLHYPLRYIAEKRWRRWRRRRQSRPPNEGQDNDGYNADKDDTAIC